MFRRTLFPVFLLLLLCATPPAQAGRKGTARRQGPPTSSHFYPDGTPLVDPYLTQAENSCRAYGWFTYNRALERDAGYSATDSLRRVRQWDSANHVAPDIQRLHEGLVMGVFRFPEATPRQHRHVVESTCLSPPASQDQNLITATPMWR